MLKKISYLFLLSIAFVFTTVNVCAQDIFCIGNGKLAVYGAGANIIQVFGPPYSSPPTSIQLKLDSNISVTSVREKGTAVWQHELKSPEKLVARITDYVVSDKPCFVRTITAYQDFTFDVQIPEKVQLTDNSKIFKGAASQAALLKVPAGSFIYNTYPLPVESYHQVLVRGNAVFSSEEIKVEKGESTILIAGGPSYPECIRRAKEILAQPENQMRERTRNYWLNFTARRINFEKRLPKDVPNRDKLVRTIDDVSILIKTQMSSEGAVLAGYNYHLGYVRDQYGVSRCLLKLGYVEEARSILNFYWNVWKGKGKIHNAQGIGVDAFHVHENDEVEITGYLIIQAFDYLKKSKDHAFIKKIFPMLEWAWNCQVKNLYKNMLPFNGDETYVAGGILPRSTLLDGSAEATLLFLSGGKLFLNWIEKNHYWKNELLTENRAILVKVEDSYRRNFLVNEVYYSNNPSRLEGLLAPAFRHGVCEALLEGCEFFSWTQKNENNRYACPKCFPKSNLPPAESKKYVIQSVSLIPLYIGSDMFQVSEVSKMVDEIIRAYNRTGNLPSRPEGGATVGYDYGLLLYNMTLLNRPGKIKIYNEMLSLPDRSGSWVEYYLNGKPSGTRYRPWESAINLEAALEFAEKYYIPSAL